ncbi:RNA polymerase sigma factor [Niabella drilacis]|uniref:RNA polymerase sigma-70 factor, ECF subfamily n=1 Tax=Niabella drilacis (strain DSM 25811 / CCM 8410 / CCUG 62505 / LMG 26954 / E90) TaxID=1285928 RepID=A0A1G6T8T4_NIADE|nr:RNA polymerase sigma-70 factor [Niabella drilacis]SDD25403.1 RNA polymerase sigma-70 factor, ECF subfamily [Niabella drilacis]
MPSKLIYQINVRLRNGDHEAFLEIYERHSALLYNFVRKYIQDQDTVADMVHDTFYNLWRSRERVKAEYPIKNYLYRIARNVVFKELEKQVKTADALANLQRQETLRVATTPVDHLGGAYRTLYEQALAQLPPQRKRIFQLCREEGLSHKEIARFLEISPNTVKEHMSLAMKSMKDYLAREHDIVMRLIILYVCFGT